jgi:hypothetical protein
MSKKESFFYIFSLYDIHTKTFLPYKKMGKTNNIKRRIKNLSTLTPFFVVADYKWKVPLESVFNVETKMKNIFKKLRLNGEWFLDKQCDLIDKVSEEIEKLNRIDIVGYDLRNEPIDLNKDSYHTNEQIESYKKLSTLQKEFYKGKQPESLKAYNDFTKRKCKLTKEQVEEIRKKYIPNVYGKKRIAGEYGVSTSVIYRIVTNKVWKI